MKGIPYQGVELTASVNSLPDRQPDIIDPLELRGVTDIHTLFRYLMQNEYLFIIEHPNTHRLFASWCWDIRFNYRDREIFIPYYSYKTFFHRAIERDLSNPYLTISTLEDEKKYILVRHDYELNKLILDDRKSKYRRNNITVYHPSTDSYVQLALTDLPYLSESLFSVPELLRRHTNYKFLLSEFDITSKTPYYYDFNSKKSREKRILLKEGYSIYADSFMDLNYQDIRTFVVSPFSEEANQMTSDDDYVTRVYDFESYLYCLFAQEAQPYELEHKQAWADLGTKKRFVTLGETYPLTLKYYYTDRPHTFRKLTYERFR